VNRRIESGKTGINSSSPLRKRKRWKEKSIKPLNWKHWNKKSLNTFSTESSGIIAPISTEKKGVKK
jgi:hypothetical protein